MEQNINVIEEELEQEVPVLQEELEENIPVVPEMVVVGSGKEEIFLVYLNQDLTEADKNATEIYQALQDKKVPYAVYFYQDTYNIVPFNDVDEYNAECSILLDTVLIQVVVDDRGTVASNSTQLAKKSEIPRYTSQLQNNSGYITNTVNYLTNYYNKDEIVFVNNFEYYYTKTEIDSTFRSEEEVFRQAIIDTANEIIRQIPSKTSQLQNDSGYIDKEVNNLTNYYTKTQSENRRIYDASYLFEDATLTHDKYMALVNAITNKVRIYLSQNNENYDALGRVYDSTTGDILLTISVGTTDDYDGNDYALDIVATFSIDGTTKAVTQTVGSTNGADIAQALDQLGTGKQDTIDSNNKLSADLVDDTSTTNKFVSASDISNWNSKVDTNTNSLTNYYTKSVNNALGGVFMPDTSQMTPIKTIEYDTSSTTYYKICSFANTATSIKDINGNALYRVTVTGTNINAVFEVAISMKQAVNTYPYIMIRNYPGATSASQTGVRYLRNIYPKAINNGANWDFEFQTYNATARHFKIEVFRADTGFTFYETLTPTTIDSDLQGGGSTQTYTNDGIWFLGSNINGTVSASTSAGYITSYLNKFISGTLPVAGQKLNAQQMCYLCPTDNKFYPSTEKTKPVDTNVGIQLNSSATNANASPSSTSIRQKYNNATLTYIPHATLTAGDRCFFRCTMDANGNIYSDDYVATSMTAGYTWYYIGTATSASAINQDTTQSMFYTLDANGKLTHINGLEIA